MPSTTSCCRMESSYARGGFLSLAARFYQIRSYYGSGGLQPVVPHTSCSTGFVSATLQGERSIRYTGSTGEVFCAAAVGRSILVVRNISYDRERSTWRL
jgi:hypothetical protein